MGNFDATGYNVDISRDSSEGYRHEYDVQVRRLTDFLQRTSPGKEALGMAISKFEPGETVREHVNKESVEEVFLVLQGDVEFVLAGEPTLLGPLDMGFAPVNQSHRFTNVGETSAQLLSIWWRTASVPVAS